MDTMSLSSLFIIATWRTNGCSFTNHNRQDPYFLLTGHQFGRYMISMPNVASYYKIQYVFFAVTKLMKSSNSKHLTLRCITELTISKLPQNLFYIARSFITHVCSLLS